MVLVASLKYSMSNILSSTISDCFTSSFPILIPIIYFLMAVARLPIICGIKVAVLLNYKPVSPTHKEVNQY